MPPIDLVAQLFPGETDYGLLLLLADGRPAVYLNGPIQPNVFRHSAIEYGISILYDYQPEGLLLHLTYAVHDQPADPYRLDTFLDPTDPADRQVLNTLTHSDQLVIVLYSSLAHSLSAKTVPWSPERRSAIQELLTSTAKHRPGDFPAAKARWLAEHT